MTNNEHELNKVVFMVEPELLQEAFNHLQQMPYHQVSNTIFKLLELRSVGVKSYTTFEVSNEAGETENKETN